MSDERRGTGGGDHPLDVEARFADIIAHFHDGEPTPPVVVDGDRDGGAAARAVDARPDAAARTPQPTQDPAEAGTGVDEVHGTYEVDAADTVDGTDPVGGVDGASGVDGVSGVDGREADWGATDRAATDWAARYEQAAREELAAHEERTARRQREDRIRDEVDRAVDRGSERFVPEEPPPLPRPADLPARLAWGAVLLGPVVLVLVALLWRTAPPWLVGSVVTAIVVGFGYLVWKLPRSHDREDGGDGAIV